MSTLDPVCGMPVDERRGTSVIHEGRTLWFCTEFCRREFQRNPAAYAPRAAASAEPLPLADRKIAYFSMEVAIGEGVPTYAGGLGVLAGDTLRSMADLRVPAIGITLVHRQGYFRQEIRGGHQIEHAAPWNPAGPMMLLAPVVEIGVEGRTLRVRTWRHELVGVGGYRLPLLLLDTDLPENDAGDRALSDSLYGGDARCRLLQEVVLGIGGVRMLRALGCAGIESYHLNEGHAALAPLELLRERAATGDWDFDWVRSRTVFTTHTPVSAGHDQFDAPLVRRVLDGVVPGEILEMLGGRGKLNMTLLALDLSHFVNGVALRHREVSSGMFPGYEIHQITNGVHSATWTSDAFQELFDRRIPGWRGDPLMLHNAIALPPGEVWMAHRRAKDGLLALLAARTGRLLARDTFTLAAARRATAYKRLDLVLSNPERLRAMARGLPLQLVLAGKAHPRDEPGKAAIARILEAAQALGEDVPVIFLEDYGLGEARRLVSGADAWLNTPLPPLEASGTSGMKAAHNGVPSVSVLDGWWKEGHVEGVTGWAVGGDPGDDASVAEDLFRKLEERILPLFYEQRDAWVRMMRQTIALNASFFNTDRVVRQYLLHAYGR